MIQSQINQKSLIGVRYSKKITKPIRNADFSAK